ncbi:MAG TPA: FliH/SctL family protein [Burkholderiales bacterium]|nr:FliH/SctL family protein [Burkholderiales bacterium]
MDALIRGARVSEHAVVLGVRAPARPDPVAASAPPEASPAPQSVEAPRDDARLEAERRKIEEALRRELDERLESAAADARSRGYGEGVEQGKAEALREAREQGAAAARAIAAVSERAAREIDGVHDLVVGIAFEAVCKTLGARAVERDAVAAIVREVVARVKQEEAILVRLHPQDCALLRGLGADSGKALAFRAELVADDKVALGGCIVETEGGLLDGRIETQIERLRGALLAARASTPPARAAQP